MPRSTHFSVLAPLSELRARRLVQAGSDEQRIRLSRDEALQQVLAQEQAE